MKYIQNIEKLSCLPIDYMGFICYPKSPRYIGENNLELADQFLHLTSSIQRVGVFVNASKEEIRQSVEKYHFDLVQLHGGESPSFCKEIQEFVPVIKAFSIEESTDLKNVANYEFACSLFIFDTKTSNYGGSGRKFDWGVLKAYDGATPFMLSGGISLGDFEAIRAIEHSMLIGVDLNSKFELEPGFKEINQIETFIKQLNNESNK